MAQECVFKQEDHSGSKLYLAAQEMTESQADGPPNITFIMMIRNGEGLEIEVKRNSSEAVRGFTVEELRTHVCKSAVCPIEGIDLVEGNEVGCNAYDVWLEIHVKSLDRPYSLDEFKSFLSEKNPYLTEPERETRAVTREKFICSSKCCSIVTHSTAFDKGKAKRIFNCHFRVLCKR